MSHHEAVVNIFNKKIKRRGRDLNSRAQRAHAT
jgi:hypothetical protein